MNEDKQLPLDEVLFGSKPAATAEPEPPLAEVISLYYREGLPKSGSSQNKARQSAGLWPAEEVRSSAWRES